MDKPTPNFVELASTLNAGAHIVIHSGFSEPRHLVEYLTQQAHLYKGVNLHTLMTMAVPPYAEESVAQQFVVNTFFPGGGVRKAVNQGLVKTRRCALTDIPAFFAKGEIKADVLLLQVSKPNDQGKVSLGLSIDYIPEVIAQNPIIIAQVNPNMPFTCGSALLDWSAIDYALEVDEPLYEFPESKADAIDSAIAKNVAGLIKDGDIVQAGIGALPDAVLENLGHLKHLGAHTGILTGAWQKLIESGVVDNSTKKTHQGKSITTMAGGQRGLYDYLDGNDSVEFHPCSYTHAFDVLSSIDNLCAINSVLQIDLQGNANAERVNGRQISTPGGLPDFASGASASKGGKSIIALRSSFKDGQISNIIFALDADNPPSLMANHINYVVTEYGVAAINHQDAEATAHALISIAHPNHREQLASDWAESNK